MIEIEYSMLFYPHQETILVDCNEAIGNTFQVNQDAESFNDKIEELCTTSN